MYVVDPRPYYKHFEACSKRIWKTKEDFELQTRENGFYAMRFKSEEDRNTILLGGTWFYDGNLIIMKNLIPEMKLDKDLLSTMSVWIWLPGLSFQAWGKKALSALVSTIKRPIKIDEPTMKRYGISYARVIVDINAENNFPNFIEGEYEDGEFFSKKLNMKTPRWDVIIVYVLAMLLLKV